jgi:hypothetical protein
MLESSVRLVRFFQVHAEQQPLWPDSKLLCAVAKSGDPVSTPAHQLYSLYSCLTADVRGTKSCPLTRQSLSLGVWLVQLLNLPMLSSEVLPCTFNCLSSVAFLGCFKLCMAALWAPENSVPPCAGLSSTTPCRGTCPKNSAA